MCKWIRNYCTNRIAANLKKLDNWPHDVMPMPRKRLDKEVMMSGQWLQNWSVGDKWQVNHSYNDEQFIVEIGKEHVHVVFGN